MSRTTRFATSVAVLLTAGLIGVGSSAGTASAASAATPAASGFPTHFAAPYLQITSGDAGDMTADMQATGVRYYTLAFLIPSSGCTAQWEDGGDAVGAFQSQISSLQSAGGDVIISFGGAAGGELAQTCTSVSSLESAYANIVNTYHVTRLDFDIEGNTLGDTASNTRRDQALAALQAANPAVRVDYTLPVDATGLPAPALNLLQDAKNQGVHVSTVNIMTMDFGNGHNPLTDAESAANATQGQLANLYPNLSSAQVWNTIGLTPIAGQNDDNENFTQADATTLENFAASNGVGELSFWELDGYDKGVGYAYSKIFNQITG